MKYKGKTIIELKDVRSGQVDRVMDDNTFMDANIEAKFRNFGIFQTSVLNSFNEVQLWRKMLGGILMFDTAIAADSNFSAVGQKMTARGYYGSSNNGSPVSLGSWNATESAISSNAVQMVYDFTTSQGNGTIASVCLTSDVAGICGLGNVDGDYNISLRTNPAGWLSPAKAYSDSRWNDSYAFDGTYLYYGVSVDGTAMTINKKYANALKVDLIHYLADANTAGQLSITLPSAMTCDDNLRLMQASATELVVVGYDSTSASDGTMSVVVIDLANSNAATVYEVTGIPGPSDNYGNIAKGDVVCVGKDSSGNILVAVPYYDNYLRSTLININTNTKHTFTDTNTYSYYTGQGYRSEARLQPIGNGQYIMMQNVSVPAMICDYSDDSALYCEATSEQNNKLVNGLDLVNYQQDNMRLTQNPFYLATINNLASAVIKTSAQTMKVTYVITRA